MVGFESYRSLNLSKWGMTYGSKGDLILSAMVGFHDLNDLQQLRMLARVPIISAYDPSRESMLAYASPSNKIAIMITGLVIDCLGTNNFLVTKSSLLKLIQLCLYLNSPQLLFTCSLYCCKPIQKHLQSNSSFILVSGKANVKCAQSCISGRQNLREYLFYLQLLVGFDTLTYRKRLQLSRILAGYQDLFLSLLPGSHSVG